MSNRNDTLDFSGLFKLDVLIHLAINSFSYYELGLKKCLALSSGRELVFFYIDQQGKRFEHRYDWDFVDNPVYCMCFEPSGTWVVILSDQKLLLVPFLPLFIPHNSFDLKWPLNSVTALPLGGISTPRTVVWWLTKESDNILIIGSKKGAVTFYSLESQTNVGVSNVSDEVNDLQICYDDSLDLLTLLITGDKSQQWKLILEHRSFDYNWLHQLRSTPDKDRKDGFINYIKQLSKDKITLFTQGGSKENKSQVEYLMKPTEYLPVFRKGSNNWFLTAQYVNGRHFLTAFESNEGTMILESPDEDVPSRTLRPLLKKDSPYVQGLWSQRLLYLLKKNELEIHSASFSVIQGDNFLSNRDHTVLWSAELIGDVLNAYLVTTRELSSVSGGWKEPTFMCDLQLPRFNLEQCLVITTAGAYLMNTVCEPTEWLVGMIMRGGVGAEQSAAALGAPVPVLLRAASDMLLSRGKLSPAQYLYSLSQSQPDGWVARLGVFGRLQELSLYKVSNAAESSLGNSAITIKLLSILLKVANSNEEIFEADTKFTSLTNVELEELCCMATCIGLWDIVPKFSVHRGNPNLFLKSIRNKNHICRGALDSLIRQKCIIPVLLEEDSKWFFDFIIENCQNFDLKILKCLCLWLCPLQDQLGPVMRDLTQGINTLYTTRIQRLITTFMHVACAIEKHNPSTELNPELPKKSVIWVNQFVPKRSVSCGLSHWAVSDDGNARVILANTQINTELIGRVVSVACGRHHTLVLTENGIYASGDNSYGQLGIGSAWPGAIGDSAVSSGQLVHVPFVWSSPVVHIAAGHYHSAALDVGGRLYTWGWGVHGQLGLGSIDDEWSPQLVTKLQGRKILSVGCGACHTVVLTKNGEVYAFGASVFGQLGTGGRDKSCVPIKVNIVESVTMIAVGYFHNLALSNKGCLYTWGGSPQSVRAAYARRSATVGVVDPTYETHLVPQLVDTCNVRGNVVQMSAGWHHSCIVDNAGILYSWGLNFDGQLGNGDRKHIQIPTETKFNRETPLDNTNREQTTVPKASIRSEKLQDVDIESMTTNALVACGGDFTIFIDDEGRIYAAGNTHQELSKDMSKIANRVIMMKTTKRVIKIPANRTNIKFLYFSSIDRIDIMFPFDIDNMHRDSIKPNQNPLTNLSSFKGKTWPDKIITTLKLWIDEESLISNPNLAAKLAYHKKNYAECLKLLLENLKQSQAYDNIYLTHTNMEKEINLESNQSNKKDELKITITNIISRRITDISLTILNEKPYPLIDPSVYKSIPCVCDEINYLPNKIKESTKKSASDTDMSTQAANIIDKCMALYPVDAELWETCFRYSKNFFLENNLAILKLETVLRKYMEINASTMASAIMYSKDCVQYSKYLSPMFYLNMCSEIMDAWN